MRKLFEDLFAALMLVTAARWEKGGR